MLLRKVNPSRLVSAVSDSYSLCFLRSTASQVTPETEVYSTPRQSLGLDSPSSAKELVKTLGHEEKRRLLSALQECVSLSPIGSGKQEAEQIFDRVDQKYPRGFLDREEFTMALRVSKLREQHERTIKSKMPVATGRLITLAMATGVPFVGFGFLDNFLMIIAGESIEQAFGVTMGLSIMAAAALGNMISDVAGVCLAENIESAARKLLGLKQPKLSQHQLNTLPVRVAKISGAAIGVCIGCILGMVPLLWYERKSKMTTQ